MFYVYVLLSEKDGRLYTGATGDLKARLHEDESMRLMELIPSVMQ